MRASSLGHYDYTLLIIPDAILVSGHNGSGFPSGADGKANAYVLGAHVTGDKSRGNDTILTLQGGAEIIVPVSYHAYRNALNAPLDYGREGVNEVKPPHMVIIGEPNENTLREDFFRETFCNWSAGSNDELVSHFEPSMVCEKLVRAHFTIFGTEKGEAVAYKIPGADIVTLFDYGPMRTERSGLLPEPMVVIARETMFFASASAMDFFIEIRESADGSTALIAGKNMPRTRLSQHLQDVYVRACSARASWD